MNSDSCKAVSGPAPFTQLPWWKHLTLVQSQARKPTPAQWVCRCAETPPDAPSPHTPSPCPFSPNTWPPCLSPTSLILSFGHRS